jgi:hypothetical protein
MRSDKCLSEPRTERVIERSKRSPPSSPLTALEDSLHWNPVESFFPDEDFLPRLGELVHVRRLRRQQRRCHTTTIRTQLVTVRFLHLRDQPMRTQ